MTKKAEVEPGLDVVLVAPHYISGLPGDGKVDMGDGRRLYPCEARVALGSRSHYYWPTEITRHFHGDPA